MVRHNTWSVRACHLAFIFNSFRGETLKISQSFVTYFIVAFCAQTLITHIHSHTAVLCCRFVKSQIFETKTEMLLRFIAFQHRHEWMNVFLFFADFPIYMYFLFIPWVSFYQPMARRCYFLFFTGWQIMSSHHWSVTIEMWVEIEFDFTGCFIYCTKWNSSLLSHRPNDIICIYFIANSMYSISISLSLSLFNII